LVIRNQATSAYKREHETTIFSHDYKQIMINNIDILPSGDFENFEEFLKYFTFANENVEELSLENIFKLLKGLNFYSDKIENTITKN